MSDSNQVAIQTSKNSGVRLIRKYPGRRLYDTQESRYIVFSDIKKLVLINEEFRVIEVKTNADLTRNILLQILLEEEECSGYPIFSEVMMKNIIRYYGHVMQPFMANYLEDTLNSLFSTQGSTEEGIQSLVNVYLDQLNNVFCEMQKGFTNSLDLRRTISNND